jgi:hypothetical protein
LLIVWEAVGSKDVYNERNHLSYQKLLKERKRKKKKCSMNRQYCCWYHSTFVLKYEEGKWCSVFFNSSFFFISTYRSTIDYLFLSISVEFNNKREGGREREKEKEMVVVFGKVQNFFLSTVIIEMNRYFIFSSLASLFFFSLNRAVYTGKQEPKYHQKESNGSIRIIEIALIFSF